MNRTQRRLLFCGAIAVIETSLVLAVWAHWSASLSDLAQLWAASRAWLHGADPYGTVGPGRPFSWPFPLLYPFTAVLAMVPVAWLPLSVVDPLFVGLSTFALAWGLTRHRLGNPQLLVFLSCGNLWVLITSQWSLLLTAAALVPALGVVLACKPTTGLALWIGWPRWQTAAAVAGAALLSVMLCPGWPREWLATLSAAGHVVAPITRRGGFLVLLALLKWRWPEARLLVAMACVPHTVFPYETIPLFLVPASWPEALLLLVLTWVIGFNVPFAFSIAHASMMADWVTWLMYLPCTALVLVRAYRASLVSVCMRVGSRLHRRKAP